MKVTRRHSLTIAAGLVALSACKRVYGADEISPEKFGAKGDGRSPDGKAVAAMIDHINAIPGDERVIAYCSQEYLLEGAPVREMAPTNHAGRPGIIHGLPPITRSNVTIDATSGRFTVPSTYPFRRIVRGGSSDDRFFVMWQLLGANIRVIGGVHDGNLMKRPFEKGPAPMGFGGNDFGFVLEGENWLLDGVSVENWGTDCALVTNVGRATGSRFVRARRNGLSVVPTVAVARQNPIVIDNCSFVDNGDWPRNMYNNPAAGLVVEAGEKVFPASVFVQDNDFSGNYLKDMQLSKGSLECVVSGNTFRNDLRLRPMQRGGHVIEKNEFLNGAQIMITATGRDAEPVLIRDNLQNGAVPDARFIRHTSTRVQGADYRQRVVN